MKAQVLILSSLLLVSLLVTPALSSGGAEERFFIVREYRYDPGTTAGDPDFGMSLCATRCNALSEDYLNYTAPGGWRVIKVASGRKLTVELNNPFLGGHCICVADEYLVKADDLNNPSTWRDPTQAAGEANKR